MIGELIAFASGVVVTFVALALIGLRQKEKEPEVRISSALKVRGDLTVTPSK